MSIAPLLSAGGSIAGGIASIFASRQAANNALMNYYLAQQERADAQRAQRAAQAEAAQVRSDQRLGTTGPTGDRTRFVPGQGYVSTLGPANAAIQQLSDDELQRRLGIDVPRQRAQVNETVADRARQGETAEALLSQFLNTTRPSESARRNQLFAAAAQGQARGADELLEGIMTQQLRRGADSSANADIFSEAAERRGEALSRAFMDAQLQARSDVRSEFDEDRTGAANLYGFFQGASEAPVGPQFTPSDAAARAGAQLTPVAQRGLFGDSAVVNAAGAINPVRGGRLPTTVDTSLADALAGGGFAAGGQFAGFSEGLKAEALLQQLLQQDPQQRRLGNTSVGPGLGGLY